MIINIDLIKEFFMRFLVTFIFVVQYGFASEAYNANFPPEVNGMAVEDFENSDQALKIFEMQHEAAFLGISQEEDEETARYSFSNTHPEMSKELHSVDLETSCPHDSPQYKFLNEGSVSISKTLTLEEMECEVVLITF